MDDEQGTPVQRAVQRHYDKRRAKSWSGLRELAGGSDLAATDSHYVRDLYESADEAWDETLPNEYEGEEGFAAFQRDLASLIGEEVLVIQSEGSALTENGFIAHRDRLVAAIPENAAYLHWFLVADRLDATMAMVSSSQYPEPPKLWLRAIRRDSDGEWRDIVNPG